MSRISSQDFESSVAGFSVPAMEDYWTRVSEAPYGGNARSFATKITTKERDDSMVKFRQYIWSAYLAFLFYVRLPLVQITYI